MSNNIQIGNFNFHPSFVKAYKGLTIIQARRKMKRYYTRSEQSLILRWLKNNGFLKADQ